MKASDIGIPTRLAIALVLVVLSPTFALLAIAVCLMAAGWVLLGKAEIEFGPGAARADAVEEGEY